MNLPAKHLFAAMLGAASLLSPGAVPATVMDAIDALDPGDMYRVLFVTSTTRDATSTNIDDYNQFVSNVAATGTVTAPLGLSWTAIASTGSANAQTNTGILSSDNTLVHFFNTAGHLLATSGADLWDGSLLNAVLYNENGNQLSTPVWTGTNANGTPNGAAALGAATPIWGASGTTNSLWIQWSTNPANVPTSFYSVSEKVTVAQHDAPEPSTLTLAGLALAGAVTMRRRKRLVA